MVCSVLQGSGGAAAELEAVAEMLVTMLHSNGAIDFLEGGSYNKKFLV